MNLLGLSAQQVNQVEQDFMAVPVKERLQEVLDAIKDCTTEEQLCLKYMYAYMPASDLTTYDVSLFLKCLRDTLEIMRKVPWGSKVTGELFFNYVLPLRINNEDLTDHREQFFHELYPRIKDLSMRDSVLEVNYWCLEKATYRSTDIRTSSPLNVIRNAFGRCGEESVLCVAALRSVGIPARQCYTPRWAHCDDNHAWVEVWADGAWHFIGACEPEPVLDRGWFTESAQRAMLIHARVFSRLVSEPYITHQTPVMTQLNILGNYAVTKNLRVIVTDGDGNPVRDAEVRFELVNFAQLYPLAVLKTDEKGEACLLTGIGDLYVHVSKDGRFLHKKADHACQELRFCMDEGRLKDTGEIILDLVPPSAGVVKNADMPEEMARQHEIRTKQANEKRLSFEKTFIQGEKAEAFAAAFPEYQKEIAGLIALSNGNHQEISAFLTGEYGIPLKYKVLLLQSLREKDLSDSTCAVLKSHLIRAFVYRDRFKDNEELFVKYVLCPRVHFEMITDYRGFIDGFFTDVQKEEFRQNPRKIHRYIEDRVKDCGEREYATISSSPAGLLKYNYGSLMSRKILFVAICRTLGIPARLSEIDCKLEYWQEGTWNTISEGDDLPVERCCRLTLKNNQPDVSFIYEKNFTVARLENGVYHTLGLDDYHFDGDSITYELEEGQYRITTSNRLNDGSVLAVLYHIELHRGKEHVLDIYLREQDMVSDERAELPEIPVITQDGRQTSAYKMLAAGKSCAAAFIEPGKEPTEHLLNEILEQKEEFKNKKDRVLLLVNDNECLQNPLLTAVLEETGIQAACRNMNGDAFPLVLKALNTDNSKLPLVLGLDEQGKCVFHISGYNVGTGDIILKHIR